jgi:hypothetical protein
MVAQPELTKATTSIKINIFLILGLLSVVKLLKKLNHRAHREKIIDGYQLSAISFLLRTQRITL